MPAWGVPVNCGSAVIDQLRPASRLTASDQRPVAGSVPETHQAPAAAWMRPGSIWFSAGGVARVADRPESGSTTSNWPKLRQIELTTKQPGSSTAPAGMAGTVPLGSTGALRQVSAESSLYQRSV